MRVGRRAWRRGLVEGHDKLRRRDLLAISEDAPGPQYGRTSLAQVAAADVWVFKRMARDTRSGIGPDADGFPLLLRAIDLALAGAVRGEGARVHAEHQGAQLPEGLRPSSSVPADRGARSHKSLGRPDRRRVSWSGATKLRSRLAPGPVCGV
jgi:hypothetical protein